MAGTDFIWTPHRTTRRSPVFREHVSQVESGPREILKLDADPDQSYDLLFKAVLAETATEILNHFYSAKQLGQPFRWTAAPEFIGGQPLVIYDPDNGHAETPIGNGLYRIDITFVGW